MSCLGFMKKVIAHGRQCVVAVTCIFVATPTQADETNIFGIAMADIPAGSFLMGSCQLNGKIIEANNKKSAFLGLEPARPNCTNNANEMPHHRVHIKAFQMGKTEVTLGQFKTFVIAAKRNDLLTDTFMGDNKYGDNAPVMVSRDDAQKFIAWLNKIDGGGWRCPAKQNGNTPAAPEKITLIAAATILKKLLGIARTVTSTHNRWEKRNPMPLASMT
jgi:formylglycine-generating enzyme required for sulfatase activity